MLKYRMDLESEDDILQRNIDQLDRETPRCNLSEEEEEEIAKQRPRQFGPSKNIWLNYGSGNVPPAPAAKGRVSNLAPVADATESLASSPYNSRAKFAEGKDHKTSHSQVAPGGGLPSKAAHVMDTEKAGAPKEIGMTGAYSKGIPIEPRHDGTHKGGALVPRHLPPSAVAPTSLGSRAHHVPSSATASVPPHVARQANVHLHQRQLSKPSSAMPMQAPKEVQQRPVKTRDIATPADNSRSGIHAPQRLPVSHKEKESAPPVAFNHSSLPPGRHHMQVAHPSHVSESGGLRVEEPEYSGKQSMMNGPNQGKTSKGSVHNPLLNKVVTSHPSSVGGNPASPSLNHMRVAGQAYPQQRYMAHAMQPRDVTRRGPPGSTYPPTGPPQEVKQPPHPLPPHSLPAQHLPSQQTKSQAMAAQKLPSQQLPAKQLPGQQIPRDQLPAGMPTQQLTPRQLTPKPLRHSHMPHHVTQKQPVDPLYPNHFQPKIRPPMPEKNAVHGRQPNTTMMQRSVLPGVQVGARGEKPFLPEGVKGYGSQKESYYAYRYNEAGGTVMYPAAYGQWCQDPGCQDCGVNRGIPDTGPAPGLPAPNPGAPPYIHTSDEILMKSRELDMCWPDEEMDCVRDFTFADRHKEMTYAERSEEGIYQRATEEGIRQPPPWHDEETDSVKNFSDRKDESRVEQQNKSESQENVCLSPPWNEEDESALTHENLVLVSRMKSNSSGQTAESSRSSALSPPSSNQQSAKKKQVKIKQESSYYYIKEETDSVRDYTTAPQQLEQSSRIPSSERIPLTPPWNDESVPLESSPMPMYKHPAPPSITGQKTEGLVTKNVDTFESRDGSDAKSAPHNQHEVSEDLGTRGHNIPEVEYEEGEDSVKDYSLAGARQQELSSKMPSYENINFTPPWISENNSGVQTPCCRHMSMSQLPVISEKEAAQGAPVSSENPVGSHHGNLSEMHDGNERKVINSFRSPSHYVNTYGYQGTGFTPEDSLKDFSLAIQEQTSRIPSSEQLCFTPPWVESVDTSEEKDDDIGSSRQELTLEEQRIIQTEVRMTGVIEAEKKARVLREEMVESGAASHENAPAPGMQVGKDSGFCSEQDKKQLSPDGQQLEDSEQTDAQVEPTVEKIPSSKPAAQQQCSIQTTTVTTTTAARKNSWSSGNSTGSNQTDISTVVNAPTSVPITAPGSPEPASDSALSDIEENDLHEGRGPKSMPQLQVGAVPDQTDPQGGASLPISHGDKAAPVCSAPGKTVMPPVPYPTMPPGSVYQEVKGHKPMLYDTQGRDIEMGYNMNYQCGKGVKGQHGVQSVASATQQPSRPVHQHPPASFANRHLPNQTYVPAHMYPHYRRMPNHHIYYSYDQPRPPPYNSCFQATAPHQSDLAPGGINHDEKKGLEEQADPLMGQVKGYIGSDKESQAVHLQHMESKASVQHPREVHSIDPSAQTAEKTDEPPRYYHLHPAVSTDDGKKLQVEHYKRGDLVVANRQHSMASNTSMEPNIQSPPRAETLDTASVVSFASMAASHQNLDSRADMVSSLLSMLGTHDKDDMARTLLAMSNSPDSCAAMRQSGCVPLLIQLLHDPDYESKGINWEARQRAALALHNIVTSGANDKRNRREVRVLRLLEIIRAHSESVLSGKMENYRSFRGAPSLREHGPGPAVAAIMKLTFEEEHKNTICELGGVQAIAELLAVDYNVNGHCHDTYTITLRKYAGMTLINTTYSDNKSKTILCTMKGAIEAIIAQLRHTEEEDLIQVSAGILRNSSWRADDHSKQQLSELGAIRALMESTQRLKTEAAIRSVLSAVWNLSAHSSTNKEEICSTPGSLQFLCFALNYRSPSRSLAVTENAGGILRNISSHVAVKPEYRKILREQGALQVLISHLRSPSTRVVSNSCGILWNLSARCIQDQELLWELGAVSMLKTLVNSKHKSISASSAAALRNLMAVKPGSSGTDTESHVSTHFRRIHTLPSRQKPQLHPTNPRKDKKYKSLSKKPRELEGTNWKDDIAKSQGEKANTMPKAKVVGGPHQAEGAKVHRRAGKESARQFYNDIYRDPPIRSAVCPNKVDPASALYAADNSDIESLESSLGDTTLESKHLGATLEDIGPVKLEREAEPIGLYPKLGPVPYQDGRREIHVVDAPKQSVGPPMIATSAHVHVDHQEGRMSRQEQMYGTHKQPQGVYMGNANTLMPPEVVQGHGYQVAPTQSMHLRGMDHAIRHEYYAKPQPSHKGPADHSRFMDLNLAQDFGKMRVRQDSSSSNSSYSPDNVPGYRYYRDMYVGVDVDEHPSRHRRSFSDSFSEFTGTNGNGNHMAERAKYLKRRSGQMHGDIITDSEVTNHDRVDNDRRRLLSDEKMFTDSELSRSSYGNFLRNSYSRYEKKVADYKQQQASHDKGKSGDGSWFPPQFQMMNRKTDNQKMAENRLRAEQEKEHLLRQGEIAEQKSGKIRDPSEEKKINSFSKISADDSHVSPLCIENVRQHDHRMGKGIPFISPPPLHENESVASRSEFQGVVPVLEVVSQLGEEIRRPQPPMPKAVPMTSSALYHDALLSEAQDHLLTPKNSAMVCLDSTQEVPLPKTVAQEFRYDVRHAVTRRSNETIFSSVQSSNEDVFRPCEHFPARHTGLWQCETCCQNNIWIRGGGIEEVKGHGLPGQFPPGAVGHFPYESASSLNLNNPQGDKPVELREIHVGSTDRLGVLDYHGPPRSFGSDVAEAPLYRDFKAQPVVSMESNTAVADYYQGKGGVNVATRQGPMITQPGHGVIPQGASRQQFGPAVPDPRTHTGTSSIEKDCKGPKGEKKRSGLLSKSETLQGLLKRKSKDKDGKKKKDKKASKSNAKGDFQVTSL